MPVQSLLAFSVPGTSVSLRDNPLIKALIVLLDERGIEHQFVDNVAGWGCLNQDWLEFTAEVETSWGWCYPTFIPQNEWETTWFPALHEGRLLMQVYYKKDGELVPHA